MYILYFASDDTGALGKFSMFPMAYPPLISEYKGWNTKKYTFSSCFLNCKLINYKIKVIICTCKIFEYVEKWAWAKPQLHQHHAYIKNKIKTPQEKSSSHL